MDHISIPVADAARTHDFYRQALAPLGWAVRGFRDGVYCAFHREGSFPVYFHVAERVAPVHLAFKAAAPDVVERWYAAACAAGGTDHGAPGPRPAYGPHYFAAFVLDPDGHNVEAVSGGVG